MIQLSSNTVMVLQDDATSEPLNTGDVQTQIIRACIASGETDSWIAGDIALAVEYALLGTEKRMVRAGELDSMILRALEDAGYPHVAAEFKRSVHSVNAEKIPPDPEKVRALLLAHAAIPPERLERIVMRTVSAMTMIGLEAASVNLVLELARQFRDGDFNVSTELPKPALHKRADGKGPILLRQSAIEPEVSAGTASFFRAHVLKLFNVTRLFTVLRIELSLSAFAELSGLSKPVTELAFWSAAGGLASAIDEICEVSDRFCAMEGEECCTPVPLCLTIRDPLPFALQYMNCPAEAGAACVKGLTQTFAASLKRTPFKISYPQE